MKKIYILFLLFLTFIFIGRIKAYECSYRKSDGSFSFKYSVVNGDIKQQFSGVETFIFDYYLSDKYNIIEDVNQDLRNELVKYFDDKCQASIYVCQGYLNINSKDTYVVLFDLQYSLSAKSFEGKIFDHSSNVTPDYFINFEPESGGNYCFEAVLVNNESNGEFVDSISNSCKFYADTLEILRNNFDECQKDNNSKYCYDYTSEKSKIVNRCNSLIQYGSYNNPCVISCLDVNADIYNIEKTLVPNGSCNVSDKIWLWILNIFKWVKYVAPVLVIILSMIDFIKAFSSPNDDDMQRVKGKFVRRLIIAALLFIIPFLLEFALNVFNLVTDDPYCSLI